MGETRVDLLHLLEDLRDAYAGSLEETILTEIIANSLDSGAHRIDLQVNAAEAALTVTDDGCGMRRRDLSRYHDIAATSKTRGEGIGFAGVGIKLGLLLCTEVVTETRRGKSHVASRWHLASKYRAPWKWVPPSDRIEEHGTSVTLHLENALSPLLDPGFLEAALRRHYRPLFEPYFEAILTPHYGAGVMFTLGGSLLLPSPVLTKDRTDIAVKFPRRRKPSATGYLIRHSDELPEERRGLTVSTLGKVIKIGWDWLGVAPARPELVEGVIEAPGLAACLTLNKADFIRTGTRGATYLMYRRAIQQAVGELLAEWGDSHKSEDMRRRKAARPVERDLEQVLLDMAEDFPLLGTLVEHRKGGQRRLPMGKTPSETGEYAAAGSIITRAEQPGAPTDPSDEVPANEETAARGDSEPSSATATMTAPDVVPAAGTVRRRKNYGLSIDFESRPEQQELGRLVESSVWINTAHPAYKRAVASRSEGYHLALSVAMALGKLAVLPAEEHDFVTAFLSHWGDALASDGKSTKSRRPRGRTKRT